MKRMITGIVALAIGGCSPSALTPSVPRSPSPSPIATLASASSATASPGSPTPSTTGQVLPDGLGAFAWATVRVAVDAAGNATSTIVEAGTLGAPATIERSIPRTEGIGRTVVGGGLVAIVTNGTSSTRIEVRNASDARLVGQVRVDAVVNEVVLDAARSLMYLGVVRGGGGLDVRRVRFDGAGRTLVSLDKRFTPDGIATERYGIALEPNGTLVVLACGKADGCRLWTAQPAATSIGQPRFLASTIPIVCQILASTSEWLAVSDDATCVADYAEAPMPYRLISLRDGATRPLGSDPFMARRFVGSGTATKLVGSVRSADWSISDIVAIDVGSRKRSTLASFSNPPAEGGGWLGVSPARLVGDWVLIQPWGVDLVTGAMPPSGRLLNVASGERIELPAGTSGSD